jgi:hypothetical protein
LKEETAFRAIRTPPVVVFLARKVSNTTKNLQKKNP